MKVIFRGEIVEKTYTTECKKCNSVLEFTKKDCTVHNDRNETVLNTKCPVCSNSIWVNQ